MVEVVNSVSVIQSSAAKPGNTSKGAVASPSSAPVAAESSAQATPQAFVNSTIRVDNLQNVVILEYRSAQTGEVLTQYPSQSQIETFKEAERLAAQAAQNHTAPPPDTAPPPAAPQQVTVAATDNSSGADAPAPAPESGDAVAATSVIA